MVNRFAQQNNHVPDFLRFGTLRRRLPNDPLRAASMLVYPGYFTAEHAAQVLESNGLPAGDAHALVQTACERYRVHLGSSTAPGDWVRFDAACDAVAARGIVVRQNFTCCRTCAEDEIDAERTGDEWGHVYFTQQDALTLAYASAQVYLGFGARDPSAAVDVAHAVTDALREQGLRYEWDGDPDDRILVRDMDWRRPLA